MNELETALREALQRHAAEAPGAEPASARLLADVRRRRATNSALLSAATIAAVLAVVLVGPLALTRNHNSTGPVDPATSNSTPTETTPPAVPMANGRIQTADEYLRQVGAACERCYSGNGLNAGSVFDQETGSLLVTESEVDRPRTGSIQVFGPDGPVTSLACNGDFSCPSSFEELALGPDPDQVSFRADGNQVEVVGFDGASQRTIDVSAALGEDDHAFLAALAWSPDRSRLAVQTQGSSHTRIWLLDRDSGALQLVYTASSTQELPRLAITGIAWSPDGSRLGFIESHWNMAAEFGTPESEMSASTKALTLVLPEPGQALSSGAGTLYEYPNRPQDAAYDGFTVFLWSPDGTRVAVRLYDQVLELSAEDGSVLARRPFMDGLLIWPAEHS